MSYDVIIVSDRVEFRDEFQPFHLLVADTGFETRITVCREANLPFDAGNRCVANVNSVGSGGVGIVAQAGGVVVVSSTELEEPPKPEL